ncbi:hypothetical protein AQUCO_01700616v1 [Aquilegia coerulea]|uniref:RING-type domain-containing protein n=1 Tax=Aquilegia coerulea TaxID=218851 RepID=A0A2G5DNX3_AQUCA|nr:hypothetical protein AQUCO_01700616v1 [Aquilegia coerulea]
MTVKYLRVQRSVLEECFTCPICHDLFEKATTISECLHTYCNNCITEIFKKRGANVCPVCKIDLGCRPANTLRVDHNLQDIKSTVFPSDDNMVNAPEVTPSMSMPPRMRKERSLLSLGVITPQAQPSFTGRRTRVVARKAGALGGSKFSSGVDDFVDDYPDGTNSLGNSSKSTRNRRQNLSISEPSKCQIPRRHAENGDGPQAERVNAQEPFGGLVEVDKAPDDFARAKVTDTPNSEIGRRRNKGKELADESKGQNENNGTNGVSPELIPRNMNKRGRRRGTSLKVQGVSAQAVLDAMSIQQSRPRNPIWFSLVASPNQEEYGSLPQINPRYLRIKDNGMTILSIQKYLMMKLNLISEKEVSHIWPFSITKLQSIFSVQAI